MSSLKLDLLDAASAALALSLVSPAEADTSSEVGANWEGEGDTSGADDDSVDVAVTGATDSPALERAGSEVIARSELADDGSVVDVEETTSEVAADSAVADSEDEATSEEGSTADEAGSDVAEAEVEGATSLVDADACSSSAETASAVSEAATVDAAGATASTADDAGGSVADADDNEVAVEEAAKGSVEEAEESALVVTTDGGPTAAMTSLKSTIGQKVH